MSTEHACKTRNFWCVGGPAQQLSEFNKFIAVGLKRLRPDVLEAIILLHLLEGINWKADRSGGVGSEIILRALHSVIWWWSDSREGKGKTKVVLLIIRYRFFRESMFSLLNQTVIVESRMLSIMSINRKDGEDEVLLWIFLSCWRWKGLCWAVFL